MKSIRMACLVEPAVVVGFELVDTGSIVGTVGMRWQHWRLHRLGYRWLVLHLVEIE